MILKLLATSELLQRMAQKINSLFMSTPVGGGHIIFAFSSVRHPSSAVQTLGFRSFEGKVFILPLQNLVWVFIGLIACMGLLLVKIGR